MKLSDEIIATLEDCYQFSSDQYIINFGVVDDWLGKIRKMENDLIQIHTYTPCTAGCGKSVRYSYSVGPGMCPDCAWKEIQYLRSKLKGD